LTLHDGNRIVKINHSIGSGRKDIHSEPDIFSFKKIDGNTGLLRIPDFQSSTVTEMFDNAYDDILKTDALIIDIRGNGGGNSGYADHIARYFSSDSIASDSWRSPIYIPAFASWGRDRSWYEYPSRLTPPVEDNEPYLKPVVILIDRGTFSAAEDFAALFKGMNRAVFVGTPTGGSTGNGVRVQLNSLVSANICSKHDTAPDGSEFVGIGIQPDIIVTESPDSYFSNTDLDSYILTALKSLRDLTAHK
ncbi:MAG: peptidase S41, partial [Muribaculaceae bacterium]|nr:peptidase S41 [Muribaculaceae bacterium]